MIYRTAILVLFIQTVLQCSLYGQNPTTSATFVLRNSQPAQLTLGVPNSGLTSYALTFPDAAGPAGSIFFASNASGQLLWLSPGSDGSLMTVSSGMPVWSTPISVLGSSFVEYATSTTQNGVADRSKYLFNVSYATGANNVGAAGAAITSVGGSTNCGATGLAITSTASGTGTATGLNVCASGGTSNYAAVFPCGNVGVGTSAPDASSLLDISSTSKGALMPRMTSSQRGSISSPATGLLVYQTNGNAGFYYYDGTGWEWLHSDSTVGTIRFIRKQNTQNFATAIALGGWNNDNDFVITFDSSQIWELELVAFVDPKGVLGITVDVGVNLTTGMGGAMFASTPTTGLVGIGASSGNFQDNMATGANALAALNLNALGILGTFVTIAKGYVTTGSSSGTATIQWRGFGLISSFDIKKNSYLKATRLQ